MRIDIVLASAEEGISKPNPEMFHRALIAANCWPDNAVMIGDRLDHDHSVGFVKGEMCSPGIAAQSEDLMAAGAGGYPGTPIGDVVITDGAFPI